MKIITLLLVLLSGHVAALDLVVGVMTKHVLSSRYVLDNKWVPYNEDNHLIGITSGKFTIATMHNSYRRRAVIAMYAPFAHRYLDLKVGVSTGYDHTLPGASYAGMTPVFSFGAKYKGVNISLFMLSAVVVTYTVGL